MGFTWLKAQLLKGCKGYKSITAMLQKKFFIRDEILSSLGKFVFFERFILIDQKCCYQLYHYFPHIISIIGKLQTLLSLIWQW